MEMKICKKCNNELPADTIHFHRQKKNEPKLRNDCKVCLGGSYGMPKGKARQAREDGMKVCSKCKETKLISDFSIEKRNLDGKRSDCKECYKKIRVKWSEKNEDYYKIYHEVKNPDYRRNIYIKNQEKEKENHRKWRMNNKEHNVQRVRKRRQLVRGLAYNYTKVDWEETKEYFDYNCAYCGKCPGNLQQDHFIPATKDGAFIKSNILPACVSCNSSKSNKDFEIWYPNHRNYCSEREGKIFIFVGMENGIQQLSIL